MTAQMYKGKVIEARIDGRFYIHGKDDLFFNQNGYSTLGNAKGAITKYLNAKEEIPAEKIVMACDNAPISALLKACGYEVVKIGSNDIHAMNEDTEKELREWYSQIVHTKPIMSRNKREGRYAGKSKNYEASGEQVKHWRTGPFGTYDSLAQTASFYKMLWS